MAADAGIYSQIHPFTMDDPLTQTAKAMQIKDAQRKFQLEDDMSGALMNSGGDLRRASQDLAARGRGTAALQVREKADTADKADVERKLKIWEQAGAWSMGLDQAYRQALQKNGGDQAAAMTEIQPIWQQTRAQAKELGLNLPEQFDPQKNFAGIATAKDHVAYFKSLAPTVHMTDTGGSVTAVNTNPLAGAVGPLAGVPPIPKTGAPTELARLQSERDALPEGDPRRADYDRTIAGYKAGHGTDVTVNTGPMSPGKTAGTKVDEDLLGVTKRVMALDQIASQYKPEYQRFANRAEYAALGVKDSTIGLTNKEKQDLTEFSSYKRNAVDQINQYIHDMTGSAMGVQEAQRLMRAIPNAGSGIFDGDSPTEFKAKLDDVISKTKMAVARLAYIKRNGMSLEDGEGKPVVALERMPALINERGAKIKEELKKAQPSADDKLLDKAVRRQLSVEFGLSND